MTQRPEGILVIGAPRSGTTLLRRILDASPEVACPGETCVFSACARFLHSDALANGVAFGALSGLGLAGFEADEVHRRLRELAFGFHRDHAARQGKPRWAEKTAIDAFHLDAIEAICGDHASFVCLVRHGMDVACSMGELTDKAGGYLSELHAYVRDEPRPLLAFARAWVDVNERIAAFAERRPANVIVVRYEDVVAEPLVQLPRVFSFLGLQWSDALLDAALGAAPQVGFGDWKTYEHTELDASGIGRYKALSRQTRDELAAIVNPTLERLGYRPMRIRGTCDADAQRRLELAMRLQAMKGGDER